MLEERNQEELRRPTDNEIKLFALRDLKRSLETEAGIVQSLFDNEALSSFRESKNSEPLKGKDIERLRNNKDIAKDIATLNNIINAVRNALFAHNDLSQSTYHINGSTLELGKNNLDRASGARKEYPYLTEAEAMIIAAITSGASNNTSKKFHDYSIYERNTGKDAELIDSGKEAFIDSLKKIKTHTLPEVFVSFGQGAFQITDKEINISPKFREHLDLIIGRLEARVKLDSILEAQTQRKKGQKNEDLINTANEVINLEKDVAMHEAEEAVQKANAANEAMAILEEAICKMAEGMEADKVDTLTPEIVENRIKAKINATDATAAAKRAKESVEATKKALENLPDSEKKLVIEKKKPDEKSLKKAEAAATSVEKIGKAETNQQWKTAAGMVEVLDFLQKRALKIKSELQSAEKKLEEAKNLALEEQDPRQEKTLENKSAINKKAKKLKEEAMLGIAVAKSENNTSEQDLKNIKATAEELLEKTTEALENEKLPENKQRLEKKKKALLAIIEMAEKAKNSIEESTNELSKKFEETEKTATEVIEATRPYTLLQIVIDAKNAMLEKHLKPATHLKKLANAMEELRTIKKEKLDLMNQELLKRAVTEAEATMAAAEKEKEKETEAEAAATKVAAETEAEAAATKVAAETEAAAKKRKAILKVTVPIVLIFLIALVVILDLSLFGIIPIATALVGLTLYAKILIISTAAGTGLGGGLLFSKASTPAKTVGVYLLGAGIASALVAGLVFGFIPGAGLLTGLALYTKIMLIALPAVGAGIGLVTPYVEFFPARGDKNEDPKKNPNATQPVSDPAATQKLPNTSETKGNPVEIPNSYSRMVEPLGGRDRSHSVDSGLEAQEVAARVASQKNPSVTFEAPKPGVAANEAPLEPEPKQGRQSRSRSWG
jgi:hypothetical protein